jgi:hypothetical protein
MLFNAKVKPFLQNECPCSCSPPSFAFAVIAATGMSDRLSELEGYRIAACTAPLRLIYSHVMYMTIKQQVAFDELVRNSAEEYLRLLKEEEKLMSLTPARDEKVERQKRAAVELCGKNMGPHDYMPIQWITVDKVENVTRMICRVCFANISLHTLIDNYPEVKI